jgi:glutathione S-transferase
MNRTWDVTSSVIASTLMGWRGSMGSRSVQQPDQLPELYDREGCPKCRLVRAAFTELNLDVRIIPVPVGGTRFLDQLKAVSGSDEVPYLVDPNTNTRLGGSDLIVEYLFRHYAGRNAPKQLQATPITLARYKLATAVRQNQGVRVEPSLAAPQDLTLYSFESSPYSRIVREKLSELELPYKLVNIGKQQRADVGPSTFRLHLGPYKPLPNTKRSEFFARHGNVQVPYLIDPNTGVDMFESADIAVYLDQTYKR